MKKLIIVAITAFIMISCGKGSEGSTATSESGYPLDTFDLVSSKGASSGEESVETSETESEYSEPETVVEETVAVADSVAVAAQ